MPQAPSTYLRGSEETLDLFPNDKKIPEEVTKALQTLRDSEHEDQELIGQVKRFASAKNSKTLLALVNDN